MQWKSAMGLVISNVKRRTSFNSDGASEKIRPALYRGPIPSVVDMHLLIVNSEPISMLVYTTAKALSGIKRKYGDSVVRYVGVVKRDPKPFNPYRYSEPADDHVDFEDIDFAPLMEVDGTAEVESKEAIPPPDPVIVPDFSDFWEAYGIRKDRSRAVEVWSGLSDQQKIDSVKGIANYVDSLPSQYAQVSAWSYLNGRRW